MWKLETRKIIQIHDLNTTKKVRERREMKREREKRKRIPKNKQKKEQMK